MKKKWSIEEEIIQGLKKDNEKLERLFVSIDLEC